MSSPVTYVELNTPDLQAASRFFAAVFDWDPQPFAAPDFLVAPAGAARGVDAGLASRDGAPRVVPVVNVGSLEETMTPPACSSGCTRTTPDAG